MNESNNEVQEITLNIGQKYESTQGYEYIVDFIARDSNNTNDLFVIYRELSNKKEDDYFIKNITDFKSVDDFEVFTKKEDEDKISINQIYQHFKTKNLYKIKAVAHKSKENFIVYEGQYDSSEFGSNPIWIREYQEFNGMKVFNSDEVDTDGKQKTPIKRFTLIN